MGAPGIWFCQDTDMGRFMQGFRRRRGRAERYRGQEGVESSAASGELLELACGVRFGPGWACTGQGALLPGLLGVRKVSRYPGTQVPKYPERPSECLGACMQYPAGAVQPARLARPGKGQQELELGEEEGRRRWVCHSALFCGDR